MKKSLFLGISIILSSIFYSSALIAETLFKINHQPTSVEEFKYVYQKNNINGQADFSKQSIEDYLQLFINYKLKVQQAKDLGLDTIPELMSEYEGYRRQLLDTHLKKEIDEPLMKQEYERSKSDVAISHVFVDKNSKKAIETIQEAYQQLKKGKDFAAVAKKYSSDSLSANNGGKIGYFTALQIGFPQIEDAMYNTKVGEFSDIIETDMGYHILKVDDVRPARGKIKVSLIKISIPNSEQGTLIAKNKIDSIYQLLLNGESFSALAAKYSDDVNTNMKGGELDWFGINTYIKEFEDAAFGIAEIGQLSKPIYTSQAWFIIKKDGVLRTQSYQESEQVLQAKIKRSKFYNQKLEQFYQKLRKDSQFKIFDDNLLKFEEYLESNIEKAPLHIENDEALYPVFSMSGKAFTQKDILNKIQENFHLASNKKGREQIQTLLKISEEKILLDYFEKQLIDSLPEYKSLLEEYENGVLIFELTKNKVWNRASSDTIGLKDFYNSLGEKYTWNKRAEIIKISSNEAIDMKKLSKEIKKRKLNSTSAWNEYITSQKKDALSISTVWVEENVSAESSDINWNIGLHQDKNGQYYQTAKVLLPQKKDLIEVRGYIVAAYQEYLEKEWINELHSKYLVEINNKVFENLIK